MATSSIADYYDLAWAAFQQQVIGMLSAGDPGWMYTTLTSVSVIAYGTSSPTSLPASTTAKNASASTPGPPFSRFPLTTSVSHTGNATSSRTAATLSIPAPDCIYDWDLDYSPEQFWCDCGPNSTYPTIPPTSRATASETVTGNCNYSVLPAATINPTPTRTPTAKVLGQNLIAGCVYEL